MDPARPVFILFSRSRLVIGMVGTSPHAFSLLFIPWTVYLLERNRFAWLPPVFLIWAQCHGGVLLGLVLLTVAWERAPGRPQLGEDVSRRFWGVRTGHDGDAARHPFLDGDSAISFEDQPYTLDEWMRPGLTETALVPFWVIAVLYVSP